MTNDAIILSFLVVFLLILYIIKHYLEYKTEQLEEDLKLIEGAKTAKDLKSNKSETTSDELVQNYLTIKYPIKTTYYMSDLKEPKYFKVTLGLNIYGYCIRLREEIPKDTFKYLELTKGFKYKKINYNGCES